MVSVNGKSISQFHGPFSKIICGPAPGASTWGTHANISGGRFTISQKEPLPNRDALTAHFTANGGVKGTIKDTTHCLTSPNFTSGPIKHRTINFSGTAEPRGKASRYCFDFDRQIPGKGFFDFSNIIEVDTSYKAVYQAMKAGTFTTTTTPNDTTDSSRRPAGCALTTSRVAGTPAEGEGQLQLLRGDLGPATRRTTPRAPLDAHARYLAK